jgi:hypothetical protein
MALSRACLRQFQHTWEWRAMRICHSSGWLLRCLTSSTYKLWISRAGIFTWLPEALLFWPEPALPIHMASLKLWKINASLSILHTVSDRNYCINVQLSCPLEWDKSDMCTLHQHQGYPARLSSRYSVTTYFTMHSSLAVSLGSLYTVTTYVLILDSQSASGKPESSKHHFSECQWTR